MSVIIFIASNSFRDKRRRRYFWFSLLLIATQFLVPGGWIYRYTSYIYLIPILLLIATETTQISNFCRNVRKAAYGLLLFNSIFAFIVTFGTTFAINQIEDYYVKCINATDRPCYQSDLFGFVHKIDPLKRKFCLIEGKENLETIPLLPSRVRILIDYKALNRNVHTNFVQDLLIKKGVIK